MLYWHLKRKSWVLWLVGYPFSSGWIWHLSILITSTTVYKFIFQSKSWFLAAGELLFSPEAETDISVSEALVQERECTFQTSRRVLVPWELHVPFPVMAESDFKSVVLPDIREPGSSESGSNVYNWATSWQNLLLPYVNNKDADQHAHPCSLISAFVVRCLDSIISILAKFKISRL